MLIVSDALKQAFMEPERTIYVRIKIGNRVFDNDDVVSIEYDSGSLSGEVFAIGSTYSNSIKVTFSDLVEGLKELDDVIYEIGIKLPDGTIGYVPMGTFIINEAIEMDRNNNKTIIECMDRMIMMGGAYVSSLTYPAPIREVVLEIVNKAGVTVDVTSFERLSADKIAKPEGYTLREAIGLVAQFEAGFATFNRFGKLEIRTLSDPMFAVPPDNYFSKGLVKNEVFFRLGGISCTTDDGDTVIQSGNSAGNQVVLENRVMTKTLLDKIYQKIQTINYYPFSLSWQGNPVLEAGDWIEVEDLQGNKFKTPNLNYSLSFSGGLSAKSSADTTTQSDVTYQYKSPLQQKIEWIQARIDAAGGNVVYEGIDEPANPKEGDLWFKIIGPDKEILVYKKDKDGNLFWDPQISTADINKVAKEMEKIIAQADADRAVAKQNFEQAVTDAAAYTNTKAQEFDNQLLIVNQDLIITKQSANNAVTQSNKAIEDAGFARVDAASAIDSAASALTKVDNLSTDVTNVRTDLNGNITALNRLKTDVDGYQITLADHTGKISTIQNNVSGLQTTIADKADKTQVTQLSNQWTQTTNLVNGHTSQISSLGTQINLKVTAGQVTEAILADKTILDTRTTNQSPAWYNSNYPRRSIVEFKDRAVMEVPGSSRFVQVTTESPWIGSSGGEIVQTAKSSDGTFQRSSIGGLASWGSWEKIIEAGELVSQINIQSGNILIQTGKLYLDTTSTHMTTAYVNDLKAKSLEAVYADIATLKTKVLTADVITSTMVKSDTALIDKIFATDANVNRLTAKTAFINSVKAIDIAADRITTGTLNAANVNIVNLNVSSLVGNTSNFVQTAWNSAAAGSVTITGNGIYSYGSDGDNIRIDDGLVRFYDSKSVYAGAIGTSYQMDSSLYSGVSVLMQQGKAFSIVRSDSVGNNSRFIYIPPNDDAIHMYKPVSLLGNKIYNIGQLEMSGEVIFGGTSRVSGADAMVKIAGTNGSALGYMNGSYLQELFRVYSSGDSVSLRSINMSNNDLKNTNMVSSTSRIDINGANGGVSLMANGFIAFRVFASGANVSYRDLNMGGNSVTNTSDRRLKEIIGSTQLDSLAAIKRWGFIDFKWKSGKDGIRFGLIAQDTPELQIYDANQDIYSVDSSKQTMMNSHAIQQLTKIVDMNQLNMMSKIDAARADIIRIDTFVTQHDLQINAMQKEIDQLKHEVQQLKGVA